MAVGKNIRGITIEFSGDTTKLGNALKKVDNEAKGIDRSLREVNNALKFNPRNTELLAQKQQLLGQKIDQTKSRLQLLRQAQAKMDDDPSVDKTSQDYMELRREIITTESKLKHFNAELRKVKYANITAAGEAFKKAGEKMRTAGMYATGAAAGMIMAGKKLLDLNATQEQAELKLVEIYKERMGASEGAAKATMELASALQKEGVIGDEVTLSGAQQLATYAKYPETINKLLPAMDNLLVQQKGVKATAEDATGIANLFGKAMMGQTGALKRVGISFTAAQEEVLKYGTEEEKAAMLAEVVTQNVGNMNKAFADTDAGKMAQVKNSLGDFGERLGHLLLPALADVAKWLNDKLLPGIEKIIKFMEGHPIIAKILVGITGLLAVGGPLLMMLGAMASGIGAILTVVPMLAGAFGALLGPVGLVIAAIAAAVAIGVALYKNWDKVKEILTTIWEGIKKAAMAIFDAIKAYFQFILNFYKTIFTTAFKAIKTVITTIFNGIKTYFTTIFNVYKKIFTTAFNAIKTFVTKVFNGVKNAIVTPIQKAKDIIKGIIDKIKGFFNFKIKLPKIKLPHFSISPKGWKFSDLLEGSIPSLGIDWYAKGGIFKSPSVIGVGEKGPEAVLPIEKLNEMLNGMADNIVNGITMGMALQSAGQGGDVTIPIYLYPSGPKMGEETVKMYDQYKKILG